MKAGSAAAALTACLTLAACGGSPPAPATSGPPAGRTPAPATSGSAHPGKVSANTASEGEIAAALTAAGVPNAERWAKEVIEYRPYPADDPNLTPLRENLAKYNPGEETVDRIVSALTP